MTGVLPVCNSTVDTHLWSVWVNPLLGHCEIIGFTLSLSQRHAFPLWDCSQDASKLSHLTTIGLKFTVITTCTIRNSLPPCVTLLQLQNKTCSSELGLISFLKQRYILTFGIKLSVAFSGKNLRSLTHNTGDKTAEWIEVRCGMQQHASCALNKAL